MRNMLALIGALVVGVGGAGWYLGWYKLNVSKGTDGNPEITTTVDTKKVTEDSSHAFKQVGAFLADQAGKAAHDAKQPGPPAGTPGPTTTDPDNSIFGPSFVTTPPEPKKPIPLIAPKN
jgi:hypothetical protein